MYYNEDLIDYDSLRNDLIDYFGTAMVIAPAAVLDLSRVERASKEELIQIAKENGFNLNNYKCKYYRK